MKERASAPVLRRDVVALDPTGEVVLSRRIGNAPAEFLRRFGELEPEPIEVVFEATDGWSWFADLLADAGIPAHMAHPLHIEPRDRQDA
jgi:transposase